MFLGNDLIEAVPVEAERLRIPGYLGSFKRTLKQKYKDMIQQYGMPAEFLVVNPEPPKVPEKKN